MKNLKDNQEDFESRIKILHEEENELNGDVITFAEIKLSKDQMAIMADPMFGFTTVDLGDYYKGKIHGNILINGSDYVTREDQPDFQYLVNLGVKALKSGMKL